MAALGEKVAHRDVIGNTSGQRIGREADCPECGHTCRVPTWEECGKIQFISGFSWVTWCDHLIGANGLYFVFRGRS